MPIAPTYPGVYIHELTSGVHTITGVATSIAAFIGWSPQGPTDKAVEVESWSDYVRLFGGLNANSHLSYAVYFFFRNGGTHAYILRLTSTDAKASTATAGNLKVPASGPGIWGDAYGVGIKQATADKTRFTLNVYLMPTKTIPKAVVVEAYPNLSMDPTDTRYAVDIVKNASDLIDLEDTSPAQPGDPPPAAPGDQDAAALGGGADGKILIAGQADFTNTLNAAL